MTPASFTSRDKHDENLGLDIFSARSKLNHYYFEGQRPTVDLGDYALIRVTASSKRSKPAKICSKNSRWVSYRHNLGILRSWRTLLLKSEARIRLFSTYRLPGSVINGGKGGMSLQVTGTLGLIRAISFLGRTVLLFVRVKSTSSIHAVYAG